MSTTARLKIAFGRMTYPDDAAAVWGARLIWPNDLLHDRQDLAARSDADKQALVEWLDGTPTGTGAIYQMREALRDPYKLGISPGTRYEIELNLYEDERGKIVGSPQGSHGYVYVAGWLKRSDPVRTDQSKEVGADGRLRYSADGSEVFPGPTGVRRSADG